MTAENVEVRITEGFGKVEFKRYFADPELVATVLDAKSDAGETDTAKWMTGAAKEEAK